jgi:hypothetical protein
VLALGEETRQPLLGERCGVRAGDPDRVEAVPARLLGQRRLEGLSVG